MLIIQQVRDFFEINIFGVCHRIGEKLGVSTASVRLFFIYMSFITHGSPVYIYLVFAFTMNTRKFLRKRFEVFKSF